jgi:hypothetical protein
MPRTRIIAGLAPLILFLPVSGTASSDRLAFGLHADIDPRCRVLSARILYPSKRELHVHALCNAQGYDLILTGDLESSQIRDAIASNGDTTVAGNRVRVKVRSPGEVWLHIFLQDDLPDLSRASLQIAVP